MKHDIIKTDNYLLVVDENKIKWWYYDTFTNKVKHSGGAEYGENSITKNIISHLPLNGSPILEGVELLPPLEQEDDVIGFPLVHYINEKHNQDRVVGFCDGYNKAKEKYKYTEEDLRKLGDMHREDGYPPITFEWLIKSLSQPKMPIGFECKASKSKPIFNGEPKTLSNVVGFTQWTWEGTYIY